jgi:hypothetical protein
MTWWDREGSNIIAILAAVLVGAVVWVLSQWISEDAWADVVGAAGGFLAALWLLNKHLRARQRKDYRRGPPV